MSGIRVKREGLFTGHRDSVYALTLVDTPSTFISSGGDGMVVQWNMDDPEEGKRIAQLPNSVYAMGYDPVSGLLMVGQNQEGIHWIDCTAQKEIASLKLSPSLFFDIRCHHRQAFVAGGDGVVTVINLENFSVIRRISHAQSNARTIAVNPVAGHLAVGYSDHMIRIFSLDDGKLEKEFSAHANSVFTLSYTPDYKWLLSGSRDARLKVWLPDEGYSLFREIPAHLFAINHLAFSPDYKHFVTCSLDKTVKVWHTESLTLLKVIDKARHAGHANSVNRLLWSSYKQRMLSASDDRTIASWDVIF